jgi:hypothetical protein
MFQELIDLFAHGIPSLFALTNFLRDPRLTAFWLTSDYFSIFEAIWLIFKLFYWLSHPPTQVDQRVQKSGEDFGMMNNKQTTQTDSACAAFFLLFCCCCEIRRSNLPFLAVFLPF